MSTEQSVLQLSYERADATGLTSASSASSSSASSSSSLSASTLSQYAAIIASSSSDQPAMRPFFINKFEIDAIKHWDVFYMRNENRVYRDRHYLTAEFDELRHAIDADRIARGQPHIDHAPIDDDNDDDDDDPKSTTIAKAAYKPSQSSASLPIASPTSAPLAHHIRVLEVGCGVGNTMFPLLINHPSLFVYGIDCSRRAISAVQQHQSYASSQRAAAWVCDLVREPLMQGAGLSYASTTSLSSSSSSSSSSPLSSSSSSLTTTSSTPSSSSTSSSSIGMLDFATLVFVLSAIHPNSMTSVLTKVHDELKPNGDGVLFIRDYCLYDMAQFRFASTSVLGSSWYVRQDGTRSYFFTIDELASLVVAAGFEIVDAKVVVKTVTNRREKSEMHRRFVQIRARTKRKEKREENQQITTSATTDASVTTTTAIESGVDIKAEG